METQSLAAHVRLSNAELQPRSGYRSIRRGVRQAFQSPTHRELRPADRPEDQLLAVARLQQRISADETERTGMKLEQMKLEDALERLKELDRLRNDFVAMVVHDIRTPNAVVGAFLEILRKDWETLDHERIVDLLTRAIANTGHVTRLVDDILTASRLESGDFSYDLKPFDIAEIIYRAVGSARAANDSMRFEVSVPDGLPPRTWRWGQAASDSPEPAIQRSEVLRKNEQRVHRRSAGGLSLEDRRRGRRPWRLQS